jgi:hypothetical protein
MNSLMGETMAIDEEHVLLAAERTLEPAQIGRARRKSLREVHSEQQGKVTDKWLRYLDIYEAAFAKFRDQPVRILEIGVQNGGSLEVWAKYFPRAIAIVGCDVNPECAKLRYDDDRIKVVIGDAGSASTERAIVAHSAEFDIIIDDGSHKSSDIIKCFARYFGHLANTGVYVAEDLHCSYRQAFEGGLYDPYSSMSFFKRLVDITNSEHWGVPRQRVETLAAFAERYAVRFDESLLASVSSIEFSNSICVIAKDMPGRNNLGPRRVAGHDAAVLEKLLARDGTLIQGTDESANPWILGTTLEIEIEAGREREIQLSQLQNEHKALVESAKNGEEIISGLQTKLEAIEKKAAAHAAKVAELEGAITSTRKKLVAQEANVIAVSAERDALLHAVKSAEEAQQSTRAQVLAAAQKSSDELSRKLANTEVLLAEKQQELAQMNSSLAESQDWVFRLSAERAVLAKESQVLERRLAEHNERLQEMTAREGLFAAQNAGMELRLAEAMAQSASLEEALAATRTKLAEKSLVLATECAAKKTAERCLADRFDEIAALTGRLDANEKELAAAHGKGARGNVEAVAAIRKQLAEKDSQIAKRFSEIAALTKALQGAERSLQEKSSELTATCDRMTRTEAELSAAAERASRQKREMDSQLAERFGEIARLTRLLCEAEAAARKAEAQRDWIREATAVLVNGSRSIKGRLSSLLPAGWRRARQMEQLKEKGVFDAQAYLSANPDVAKSTQDALRHYLRHGLTEGRALCLSAKDGAKV